MAGFIAYRSYETGRDEIYVRPFPNVEQGKWQISGDWGVSTLWAPDGRELFYRSGDRMMVVRVETEPTFKAGSPELLFTGSYSVAAGRNYDIDPDGQRFLMLKEVEEQASRTISADRRRELVRGTQATGADGGVIGPAYCRVAWCESTGTSGPIRVNSMSAFGPRLCEKSKTSLI